MWKVIDYKPEYQDKMIEMVMENYGTIEISNKDFLDWQYFQNPAGAPIIKLAYDEEQDTFAGQYIILPCRIKIDEKIAFCMLSLDTLTKQSYRGQGIFKNLTELAYIEAKEKEYYSIITLPNENSTPGFFKYFNFKLICKFPVLLRPIDCKAIIGKKVGSAAKPLGSLMNIFYQSSKVSAQNDCSIEKLTYDNVQLFDGFWEKIKDYYPNMFVKDAAYIKWRYLDVPVRKYEVYCLIKNGVLEGFIAGIEKAVSGLRAGIITDFLIQKEVSDQNAKALVNQLINCFFGNGLEMAMAFFPPHTHEYQMIHKSKFFRCPQRLEPREFIVIYNIFSEIFNRETAEVRDDKYKWFTSIGDYLLV